MLFFLKTIFFFLLLSHCIAEDFLSIKDVTNIANLRKGPGDWYPIKWVIETPSLPLKLLEKGDNFNKVELHDGTVGWLSKILTSNKRNIVVLDDTFLIDDKENIKAKVLKDNIIKEFDCNIEKTPTLCEVSIKKIKGYIKKKYLWGY